MIPELPTRRAFLAAAASLAVLQALPAPARAAGALDARTTAEQATAGLDLRGRTVLLTGCTSGIGQEILRVLALRGAHVLGTSRSLASARRACAAVARRATPYALDLGDFDSVVACGDAVRATGAVLDAVVCNAGIVLAAPERIRGIEKQFVVNHLGHHLLVRRLLDRVIAAPGGRVVVLGSGSERDAPPGGIQFDDLAATGWPDRGYSHSKLANGLFSLELSRRLAKTRATSNCVSPGHTRTNILHASGNRYRNDARDVTTGAATPCWLAVAPGAQGRNGGYWHDFQQAPQSARQRDAAMAARLWRVSDDLVRAWLPA